MNEQVHEPVYRAAIESAHTELRQISETINRLRSRQEQIYAAAEALETLVSHADARPAAKPVYTMAEAPVEKIKALA